MTKQIRSASALVSVAAVIVIGHTFAATARAADGPVIESQRLRLVMREDLSGPASVVDRRTGRDYVAAADQPVALYRLTVGRSAGQARTITSVEASRRWCKPVDDGLELHFTHTDPDRLEVVCRVTARSDDPMTRWRISVTNQGSQPVIGVEYPIITCAARLGDVSTDDAIAYGEQQFVRPETFERLLPQPVRVADHGRTAEEGIGIHWQRHFKPGARRDSKRDEVLLFGPRTLGHGSFSGCVFLVDPDQELVVVQVRKRTGPRSGEWSPRFFQTIAAVLSE